VCATVGIICFVETLVDIALTDDERRLLVCGLNEWGGPAQCTDEMAAAMGFDDCAGLRLQRRRLREAVTAGDPLTVSDWRRTLLATEVVFVSDVVGSGLDWRITTGLSDAESLVLLRQVQRKMPRWRGSWQFDRADDGGITMRDSDRKPPGM
jgi:hypothetical protein